MIITSDAKKKNFTKINTPLLKNKLGIERNFLNIVKTSYEKPIANSYSTVKDLTGFPLVLRTEQGCLLSPPLFKIVLEVLVRTTR